MRNVIKEIKNLIFELYQLWRDGISLKIAIKLADLKQRSQNKQFFVLPDINGTLRVLCPDDIDYLKKPIKERYFEHGHFERKKMKDGTIKKKYVKGGVKVKKYYQINPKVTRENIMAECFYYTPYSLNNSGSISAEDRARKYVEYKNFLSALRLKNSLK